MNKFTSITLACSLPMSLFSRQAPNRLIPNKEEIRIYEIVLKEYTAKFLVSTEMLCKSASDLNEIWKYVTDKQGKRWEAIPRSPALSEAFNSLTERSKEESTIKPWSTIFHFIENTSGSVPSNTSIFYLSPIGFNQAKFIAIVLRVGMQGPLAGSGEFIILRKTNGTWMIEEERTFCMF
ncbi:MAG TPA: hypothetical protein VK465_10630 [Fibrobacteria bacterium]|nr:hypothetical protein [Fibrobacteria bacterium]